MRDLDGQIDKSHEIFFFCDKRNGVSTCPVLTLPQPGTPFKGTRRRGNLLIPDSCPYGVMSTIHRMYSFNLLILIFDIFRITVRVYKFVKIVYETTDVIPVLLERDLLARIIHFFYK